MERTVGLPIFRDDRVDLVHLLFPHPIGLSHEAKHASEFDVPKEEARRRVCTYLGPEFLLDDPIQAFRDFLRDRVQLLVRQLRVGGGEGRVVVVVLVVPVPEHLVQVELDALLHRLDRGREHGVLTVELVLLGQFHALEDRVHLAIEGVLVLEVGGVFAVAVEAGVHLVQLGVLLVELDLAVRLLEALHLEFGQRLRLLAEGLVAPALPAPPLAATPVGGDHRVGGKEQEPTQITFQFAAHESQRRW